MDDLLDEFDDLELQDLERYDTRSGYETEDEGAGDGDAAGPSDAGPSRPPPSPTKSSEPGDLTCAICLGDIPLENLAMVKGCDHIYCAHCILHWALHKEEPWCPQCKQPFSYLLTYRSLDGELSDFPSEESVVLLKRARWFVDSLRPCERSSALLEDSILADDTAWHEYADEFDLAEDEEIEAFYFSSAAGRARVLLGNRRFGEGGFIAGGHRQARPVPAPRKAKGKGTGKGNNARAPAEAAPVAVATDAGPSGSGSGSGRAPTPAVRTPNAGGGRHAAAALGTSPRLSGELLLGSSPGVYGSSPSGSGRRARRNARRAAADAAEDSGGSATPPRVPLPPPRPPAAVAPAPS